MENSISNEDKEFKDAMFKLKWGIDYITEEVEKLPKNIKDTIDDSCEYNYKTLAKKISSSIEDMKKFEECIQSEREEIISRLDTTWRAISDKHEEVQKRIEKIQARKIEVDTYRMKEVLELLNRLESYTPETWKRFESICSKLSQA